MTQADPVQGECKHAATCEKAQQGQCAAAINHDLARGVVSRVGGNAADPGPCAAPPAPETPPPPATPGAGGAGGVLSLSPLPVSENLAARNSAPVADPLARAVSLCDEAARGFYALSDAAERADEEQASEAYGDAADQMARVARLIREPSQDDVRALIHAIAKTRGVLLTLAPGVHLTPGEAATVVRFLRAMDAWRPGAAIQPARWADRIEKREAAV